MAKFDLSKYDTVKNSNRGFDAHIYDPVTLEETDIVIQILGKDSDKYRELSAKLQQKRLDKLTRSGGFRNKSVSVAGQEADNIRLLAECTLGWSGLVINDKEIPFSIDEAVEVYTNYPFIREQIDEAMGDRANFLGK